MYNIFFKLWLSFFFFFNNSSLYFFIYSKCYVNDNFLNLYSDESIYRLFFLRKDILDFFKFKYNKFNFNWFFMSKKNFILKNFFSIFNDIKRDYVLKVRRKE
jgi:hypothetical protein